MNAFNKLENKILPKVQNGYAEDIPNFFKCIIKFQFENKEEIRKIHSSLLKYINSKSPVFFLRLYGSYSKTNYHLQRRGFLSEYKDNTRLTFCDNTFTLLFTGMKLAGIPYSYEDIDKLFNQRKLIVGFGQVSEEKELSFFTPKGAKRANINAKGWYQAHIKPTGYGYNDTSLTKLFPNPTRELFQEQNNIRQVNDVLTNEQVEILRAHFLRLIHPFNSFLVPKRNHIEYNGNNIGEENELINYVRNYLEKLFPEEYKEFDEKSIKYIVPESDKIISEIKWFENPKNKPKPVKDNKNSKEIKDSKSSITKVENSENEILSEFNIEKSLRAIGKEIYATILYPEISKNIDIKHYEISEKHLKYSSFTENSQRSRLSKAKSIFRSGGEIEALINVFESNKVSTEIKGKVYELIKKSS
ncbi:hypothetical protein OAJ14_08365 [Polaribacter sp.]|nr:hypothetical protein [Polaribacter sp.]